MSVPHLIKQIRALPFADMMVIAEELKARIGELTRHQIEAVTLAQILTRLEANTLELSDSTKHEEKILKEIFNVKRTLTISKRNQGWELGIQTLPASTVLGTELRPMFPMLLDQIITMHVLGKK